MRRHDHVAVRGAREAAHQADELAHLDRLISSPPNTSATLSITMQIGLHLARLRQQRVIERCRPHDPVAPHGRQQLARLVVAIHQRENVQIRRDVGIARAVVLEDRLQAAHKLALVVLAIDEQHRPLFGQRAQPVLAEHMRDGELQQHEAFAGAAVTGKQSDVAPREAVLDAPFARRDRFGVVLREIDRNELEPACRRRRRVWPAPAGNPAAPRPPPIAAQPCRRRS